MRAVHTLVFTTLNPAMGNFFLNGLDDKWTALRQSYSDFKFLLKGQYHLAVAGWCI